MNTNKVMAGIVLYNAKPERLNQEIKSVENQVDFICIVDNSSNNLDDIKEILVNKKNIVIIENQNNEGMGKALNQICDFALINKYEWVLLLDHDTICPNDMVNEYRKFIKKSVGQLCPNVIDQTIVNNSWRFNSREYFEKIERCIQSGTLIRISAWKKVEGFDEEMFIDFIDFDFCKKLIINKYDIIRCNKVTIDHQLGARKETKYAGLFKKLYKITGMKLFKYLTYKNIFSNVRTYYCTRNNIIFIKRYWHDINKGKEIKDFFVRIIKRIIRSENRLMIIKETYKGIVDGINKRVECYVVK